MLFKKDFGVSPEQAFHVLFYVYDFAVFISLLFKHFIRSLTVVAFGSEQNLLT